MLRILSPSPFGRQKVDRRKGETFAGEIVEFGIELDPQIHEPLQVDESDFAPFLHPGEILGVPRKAACADKKVCVFFVDVGKECTQALATYALLLALDLHFDPRRPCS